MASYTVAANQRGVYEKTAAAGVEDTVTFGKDVERVEVKVLSGTAPAYFTLDNTAATDKAQTCLDVQVGQAVSDEPRTGGNTVVRFICRAECVYSVNEA